MGWGSTQDLMIFKGNGIIIMNEGYRIFFYTLLSPFIN